MKTLMRSTRITSTLTALLIAALLIPASLSSRLSAHAQDVEAQAVAGDLDTSFGNGGKTTTDFSGKSVVAHAIASQADGKLVVAGNTTRAPLGMAVARFNIDGTLDSSFGAGGTVLTDFFGNNVEGNAVAIQTDGRIVVAGDATATNQRDSQDFALVRYNTDGSLDTSFGNGGKVTTDLSGHSEYAYALAILPDGRLLVGGDAYSQGVSVNDSSDFVLARYNSNGSLDTTFGAGGKVVTDFFGHFDLMDAMAVQSDGKIIAAGYALSNPSDDSQDFCLVRYNADGSLDQSFGTGGKVTTDFFGHIDYAAAIGIRRDGKIAAAGQCFTGSGFDTSNFAVALYNPNGSLDAAFGTGGKVSTDFSLQGDGANALAIQPDDKLLIAGFAGVPLGKDDFGLARYNTDGSLDQTFGAGGKITTDFGQFDDANAIVLQADGKVTLAGSSHSSTSGFVMALARYVAITGQGFSLAFDPSPVTGERGATVKVHVLINRSGGFAGNVTVTPPDASAIDIKVKPPAPISTTDTAVTFKLKIKGGAPAGPQSLTFTGSDDSGHTATATLTLVIQ